MSSSRIPVTLVDVAIGGSKAGPPIFTARVDLAFTLVPVLTAHVLEHRGVITGCSLSEFTQSPQRPCFWAHDTEQPTIPIESRSDSGLISMQEECDRCWDAAFADAEKRNSWLSLLGAHKNMRKRILSPFVTAEVFITVPNTCREFIANLAARVDEPDIRILGYTLLSAWLSFSKRKTLSSWRYVCDCGHVAHRVPGQYRWSVEVNKHTPQSFLSDEDLGNIYMEKPAWA